MTSRQLESFLLACKLGSFTKAASASFISTPAFAQQISLLEQDIGFRLFERSSRGVKLTPAGAEFEKTASEIMRLYHEGIARGLSLDAHANNVVRIGCDPTEVAPFLSDVCSLARTQNASLAIELVESSYASQLEDLADGAFDTCFFADSHRIEALGLAFIPLYEDVFCCCMSPSCELASKSIVRPHEMAGHRVFIERIYRDELQTSLMIEQLCAEGIELDIDETPFDATLPTSIIMSDALLPVPQRYIRDCVPPLVAVPLDIPASTYGLVCASNPTAAFRLFAQAARSYFENGMADNAGRA